jgi:DNA-binding MarR family transcriptional regulator
MREGGSLIAQTHRLGARVFARLLREGGVSALNPAQGRILYELWKDDGLKQGELARRTKLDKSSLTLALDRMEAEGMIVRERVEGDARQRAVRCSEATNRMRPVLDAVSTRMIQIFYAGMSEAEIDAFEAALRTIVANLEAALRGE